MRSAIAIDESALILIVPIRQMVVQIIEIMLALVAVRRNHHIITILIPEIGIGLFHAHHGVTLKLNGLRGA